VVVVKLRLKPVRDQVIVITGASSGIGLTTARLAARRGARLVLVARSARALATLVDEIRASDGSAIAVVGDVRIPADVERVAHEAVRTYGHFDTWVNNAAVSVYATGMDISLDDLHQVMETNFWGTVYGSRTACAHLRARGGALINVGSAVSDRAAPLQAIYSSSKHAIKGWTEALRTELLHENAPISVTLIKPGPINTPYAEHAKNYLDDHPQHFPPVYTPDSVARAILYAAAHPVRELYVGASASILAKVSGAMPNAVDWFMARVFVPATHSHRPRHGRSTLYNAGEDLRERGDYHGLVRASVSTLLVTHPAVVRVGLLGTAAVLGWLLRTSRGSRERSQPRLQEVGATV
jgi:short-subunit dehydrogenase